jgi:hypothetical protein
VAPGAAAGIISPSLLEVVDKSKIIHELLLPTDIIVDETSKEYLIREDTGTESESKKEKKLQKSSEVLIA